MNELANIIGAAGVIVLILLLGIGINYLEIW